MRVRGVAGVIIAAVVLLIVVSTCPMWSAMLPARLRVGRLEEGQIAVVDSLLVAKQGVQGLIGPSIPLHTIT